MNRKDGKEAEHSVRNLCFFFCGLIEMEDFIF